jgi:hypothetical protein
MEDFSVELNEWWELANAHFKEKMTKNWLYIRRMKIAKDNVYFLLKRHLKTSCTRIQIAQTY